MKANELMIGDWVQLHNTRYRIEEISQKGWVHLVSNGVRANMTSDYLFDVVKPIALTEDILHKIGFMQHTDGWYLLIDEEMSISSFITHEVVFHPNSIVVVNSASCRLQHNTCRYVHELQHILRVCDIKYEFTL